MHHLFQRKEELQRAKLEGLRGQLSEPSLLASSEHDPDESHDLGESHDLDDSFHTVDYESEGEEEYSKEDLGIDSKKTDGNGDREKNDSTNTKQASAGGHDRSVTMVKEGQDVDETKMEEEEDFPPHNLDDMVTVDEVGLSDDEDVRNHMIGSLFCVPDLKFNFHLQ